MRLWLIIFGLLLPSLVRGDEIPLLLPSNPPLAYFRDSEAQGLMGEAAAIILKEMEREFTPQEKSLLRIYAEMANNDFRGVAVGVARDYVRKAADVYFSTTVITEYAIMVTRQKKTFDFYNSTDLAGKHIGIRRGFSYPLLEAKSAIILEAGDDHINNVKKMRESKLDGAIISSISGMTQVIDAGFEKKLRIHPFAVDAVNFSYALSKKDFSPAEITLFEKKLRSLIESEKWQELVSKYGGNGLYANYPVIEE